MKNATPYIILLIVTCLLVWLYFSKQSGHEREVNRLTKERDSAIHKANLESNKAEEWRKTALDYGNQQRKDATRAVKAENRLAYEIEENRRLRNRPVIRYAEPQLDSIRAARYPN